MNEKNTKTTAESIYSTLYVSPYGVMGASFPTGDLLHISSPMEMKTLILCLAKDVSALGTMIANCQWHNKTSRLLTQMLIEDKTYNQERCYRLVETIYRELAREVIDPYLPAWQQLRQHVADFLYAYDTTGEGVAP